MLRMSWYSISEDPISSAPRRRSRMYLASSSRPTLTSHLGDSGKNQRIAKRKSSGRIWKAIGNLQTKGEKPLSTNEQPNPSQYATTTPKILLVNSMATNCPREVWEAVSVAQTGTMTFRIPVPMPLTTRAGRGQYCLLIFPKYITWLGAVVSSDTYRRSSSWRSWQRFAMQHQREPKRKQDQAS